MKLDALSVPHTAENDALNDYEEAERFFRFIKDIILPFEPSSFRSHSPFHKALMFSACKTRSVVAAPRGFLKSQIYSIYRPLHRLVDPLRRPGDPPTTEILLVSETEALSRKNLAAIRNHIENNPYLIRRYGQLAPTSKNAQWSRDSLELANGNRAYALGSASQIRGRHPTDIVGDDLESRANMDSPEKLERLKDWFYRDLMGSMIPETRIAIVGTIIMRQCLLQELLANHEWYGRKWRALEPIDQVAHAALEDLPMGEDPRLFVEQSKECYTSLWPERYSVEQLLKRRAIMGKHRFNAEYQNEPRALSDPIVEDGWIKLVEHSRIPDRSTAVRRYMGVDPAVTEGKWGCYSAITIMDEQPNGELVERLSWRAKVTGPELIRSIARIWHEFADRPIRLGIEDNATQKFVRQALFELHPHITVIPLRSTVDKVTRLVDVSRYFELGYITLTTQSFYDEVLDFPSGDLDRVDSLVFCLKMYEGDHPQLIIPQAHSDLPQYQGLDDASLEFRMGREADAANPFTNNLRHKQLQAARQEAIELSEWFTY